MLETQEKPIKFAEDWSATADSYRELRESAMNKYRELGLPHTKLEDWRSTSIRDIVETDFSVDEPMIGDIGAILETIPLAENAVVAVFINGTFSARHSNIDEIASGVTIAPIASAQPDRLGSVATFEKDAFTALNTARFSDGLYVHVPRETTLSKPIFAIFIGTGEKPVAVHQRVLAIIEESAEATLIETHVVPNGQKAFINSVTECIVGSSAKLDHAKLQIGSTDAFHITHFQAEAAEQSRIHQTNVTLGGAIVRNDSRAVLNGEFAEVTLNGLYIATGTQHIDNHTTLDHAKANCPSFELYKGVLDDKATGVFRGRIIVRQDAQKTDSKQSNMNLILSDDATAFSKPQLEIFADDVKCTHGATIGKIDEEALFYLRSRGIPVESGRHLLTYAFASDVLADFPVEEVKEKLEALLFARFTSEGELPNNHDKRA